MGASAGRVLLIPKGNWNGTDTYNCLDWVRHNRAAWVCKKTCINSEPSETNTEYWQLLAEDPESVADMVGATESQNGTHGLVPAPQIGDEKKALLGDGTWGTVDAIYSFKTEEEYNQAVENDEIPDGAKVIKEYDEDFSPIDIDDVMSDTSDNPAKNKVTKKYVDDTKSEIQSDLSQLSNPNLLINPDFKINQRGGKIALQGVNCYFDTDCTNLSGQMNQAAEQCTLISNGNYTFTDSFNGTYYVKASDVVDGYVGSVYTVDRWRSYESDSIITINEGYISVKRQIAQHLENYSDLYGRELTLTIRTEDGVYSASSLFSGEDGSYCVHFISDGEWIVLYKNGTHCSVQYNNTNDISKKIYWFKLELGSIATPFVPPDPATELTKCQRYFQRNKVDVPDQTYKIGCAVGVRQNNEFINVGSIFPTVMRSVPTVNLTYVRPTTGTADDMSANTVAGSITQYGLDWIYSEAGAFNESYGNNYYVCYTADAEIY